MSIRPQIRGSKPIDIYIPSVRMRGLLLQWIGECKQIEDVVHLKSE